LYILSVEWHLGLRLAQLRAREIFYQMTLLAVLLKLTYPVEFVRKMYITFAHASCNHKTSNTYRDIGRSWAGHYRSFS